jgi:hypothetical protein
MSTIRYVFMVFDGHIYVYPPHLLQQPDEAHSKSIAPSLISNPSQVIAGTGTDA